jgi:hypothetical protein
MGRAGIEPATLGLRVLPGRLQRPALNGKSLQSGKATTASSCDELRPPETSRYSRPYSRDVDPPQD